MAQTPAQMRSKLRPESRPCARPVGMDCPGDLPLRGAAKGRGGRPLSGITPASPAQSRLRASALRRAPNVSHGSKGNLGHRTSHKVVNAHLYGGQLPEPTRQTESPRRATAQSIRWALINSLYGKPLGRLLSARRKKPRRTALNRPGKTERIPVSNPRSLPYPQDKAGRGQGGLISCNFVSAYPPQFTGGIL